MALQLRLTYRRGGSRPWSEPGDRRAGWLVSESDVHASGNSHALDSDAKLRVAANRLSSVARAKISRESRRLSIEHVRGLKCVHHGLSRHGLVLLLSGYRRSRLQLQELKSAETALTKKLDKATRDW